MFLYAVDIILISFRRTGFYDLCVANASHTLWCLVGAGESFPTQ